MMMVIRTLLVPVAMVTYVVYDLPRSVLKSRAARRRLRTRALLLGPRVS